MPRRAVLSLVSVAVLAGCGARASSPPPPKGTPYGDYLADGAPPAPGRPPGTTELDAMRLHLIDVGQGTAALVELPCGVILYDTGGELNDQFDGVQALIRYLDAFFARRRDLGKRIDLLVISHPHIDHTRGLAAVLGRYQVKNVVDNGDVREEIGGHEQLAMHEWLARRPRVGHVDVAAADVPDEGLTSPVIDPIGACDGSATDPVIRALWGGPLGREEVGHDPNDDSVVLRVDFGEASLLLPGDLERLGIARLIKRFEARPAMLDADIFLVPHHGSKHSTALALVERVSPEVALISAGPYERHLGSEEEYTARAFGHPSKITLLDLTDARGVTGRRPAPATVMLGLRGRWKETPSEFEEAVIDRAVYSTGWDGTIIVTGWSNGWIEVATERGPAPTARALREN
jgi:competence protein ComEC